MMNFEQINGRMGRAGVMEIASILLMLWLISPAQSFASVHHEHHHAHSSLHSFSGGGPFAGHRPTQILPHCKARGHNLLNVDCPHIKASTETKSKEMLSSECPIDSKKQASSTGFSGPFTGEPEEAIVFDLHLKECSAVLSRNDALYFTRAGPPNPPPR